VLLLAVYNREGKLDKSRELVDYLRTRYPRNYLFAIERGRLLYAKGDQAEGQRTFQDLVNDKRTSDEATDVVNYQWGEALRAAGDWSGALGKVLQSDRMAGLRVGACVNGASERGPDARHAGEAAGGFS
jgi:hypothetical protein